MSNIVRLLHITDTHLRTKGTDFPRDDRKTNLGFEPQTREQVLGDIFERIASTLQAKNERLDGVVFCGDAQSRAEPGGHEQLYELLIQHFFNLGITPAKILAVPGNHDIPRGTVPGTQARYSAFLDVWRKHECVTPWLDGIDSRSVSEWRKHVLMDETHGWAIIAINSCNWSHVEAIPEPLRPIWKQIATKFGEGDSAKESVLQEALQKLVNFDAARISEEQLDVLRSVLQNLPANTKRQVRIAALHHHLRAPSMREEVKPFGDITNLELLRTFLRQQKFGVVLHGHKHEANVQTEVIPVKNDPDGHPVLVVSGASFDAGQDADAVRVLELKGLPYAPRLCITPYPVVRRGAELEGTKASSHRLWRHNEYASSSPVVVHGTDYDEVYARVREVADNEAKGKALVVHLDLADGSVVKKLPMDYPGHATAEGGNKWLTDLVSWWQAPRSKLDYRVRYIHGNRLYNFAAEMNQIERVGNLLKNKDTSRAIAVIIDPNRDFREDYAGGQPTSEWREFASFCLIQFSRRKGDSKDYIDCVAYYRAQEMVQWWPINIAELHMLQTEVCRYTKGAAVPGRITTITPSARTSSRSPTHVAMPAIDRWIDQAPEKLFLIASTLAAGTLRTDAERAAAEEWRKMLSSLAASAQSSVTVDGGPIVAIEGPELVAQYLAHASGPNQTRCLALSTQLRQLVKQGKKVPRPTHADFAEWVTDTTALLQAIERECSDIWERSSTTSKLSVQAKRTSTAGGKMRRIHPKP